MTFESIVLVWIGIALFAFIYLLFKPAPYGRHVQNGWGPVLNSRVAWIIMETPVFIIVFLYFAIHFSTLDPGNSILLSLFLLHYFNRCFIYPFRLQSVQNKMPLTIVLAAVLFNLVNGNILGYSFTFTETGVDLDMKFFIGVFIFFCGMVINIQSDEILIQLRKNSKTYSIPKGGLYEYISCPNYFGEIVEWLGFAIAAGNIGAFSFLIWTCANLIPRAIANHKWYKTKFSEYPKERKAVFPFLL